VSLATSEDLSLTHAPGLELHRLESKYVRRPNRNSYLANAQYVDGAYVYTSVSSPAMSSSHQQQSSSSRHRQQEPSSSARDTERVYSSESMTAAEREQRRVERERRRTERASVKAIAEAARTRPPKQKLKADNSGSSAASGKVAKPERKRDERRI
jgi:hypothetical protein